MAGLARHHLYLLTEDDSDDQIVLFLLEMMTGRRLEVVTTHLRRRGGIGEVRKKLPLMLSAIRRSGVQASAVFTVVIDNDRSVEHASHPGGDRAHGCRHCDVLATVRQLFPDGWPIPGAVAVPVQMIETWLLLMHDKTKYPLESALPPCARSDQGVAIRIHGPSPPPQLKDLVDLECRRAGRTKGDFALDCIQRLDADDLAARSPSFASFRNQVAEWPP
jgi:hypothetical protein